MRQDMNFARAWRQMSDEYNLLTAGYHWIFSVFERMIARGSQTATQGTSIWWSQPCVSPYSPECYVLDHRDQMRRRYLPYRDRSTSSKRCRSNFSLPQETFRTLSCPDHTQEDLEDVRGSVHIPVHSRASTAIGPTMEHTMNLVM